MFSILNLQVMDTEPVGFQLLQNPNITAHIVFGKYWHECKVLHLFTRVLHKVSGRQIRGEIAKVYSLHYKDLTANDLSDRDFAAWPSLPAVISHL